MADHTGDFGPHALRDLPGVRSTYVDGTLNQMRIRPPILYAHRPTEAMAPQPVGWRYRIEYSTDGSTWHEHATSDLQAAVAADGRPARVAHRSHTFGDVSWLREYRVCIEMAWFLPDARTICGQADHWVEWYELLGAGPTRPVAGSVRGEVFQD